MKSKQYKIVTPMTVEGTQLGKLLLHPCASRKHRVYFTEGNKPQAMRRLQLLSVVLNNGGTGCLLPLCTIESDLHIGHGIPLLQPGLKLSFLGIGQTDILPRIFQPAFPGSSLGLSRFHCRLMLHVCKMQRV